MMPLKALFNFIISIQAQPNVAISSLENELKQLIDNLTKIGTDNSNDCKNNFAIDDCENDSFKNLHIPANLAEITNSIVSREVDKYISNRDLSYSRLLPSLDDGRKSGDEESEFDLDFIDNVVNGEQEHSGNKKGFEQNNDCKSRSRRIRFKDLSDEAKAEHSAAVKAMKKERKVRKKGQKGHDKNDNSNTDKDLPTVLVADKIL